MKDELLNNRKTLNKTKYIMEDEEMEEKDFKVTRKHIVGYLLMISGVVISVFNCIVNYKDNTPFGNIFLFILSGMVFAAGLSVIFNKKMETENEPK